MTKVLLLVVAAAVLWLRTVPLGLPAAGDEAPALRHVASDGREHPFLGDYDSYLWLRQARSYLRSGSVCDAETPACRDTFTNAPVGGGMKYARSLHTAAIVAFHRAIAAIDPRYPLDASAYWVPVVGGVIAILPAYLLGRRLGGDLSGLLAALLVGCNPGVLARTIGSDSDIWNAVLPLAAVTAAACDRAALAGALVGLHALAWTGWPLSFAVVFAGLASTTLLGWLRRAPEAGSAARTLGVFTATAIAASAIAGAGGAWSGMPAALVGEVLPGPRGVGHWPDVLATVAELAPPTRDTIGLSMGGPPYLFAGWLGLLLLLLPLRDWRASHWAVLVGGMLLHPLVTGPELGSGARAAVLASPVVATLALTRWDPTEERPRLLLAAWFLATLFLARAHARFVFLLAVPCAVAAAITVGRLHAAVAPRAPRALRPVVFALFVATGLPALMIGYNTARDYLPRMNVAWWETLTRLRDESPKDAIVFAWWDYGHWIKYVAERRVAADGTSLLTHIPYWMGRALLAPTERESIGLLRMLACGSEATPTPEGSQGALGRLVAAGLGELDAHDLTLELARDDRATARARLAARGLDPDRILPATHCAPPPAYLVLSTREIALPGWARLGGWDVRRGLSPRLPARYVRGGWETCRRAPNGDLACPRFGYDAADPARSLVFPEHPPGIPASPALLALVRDAGFEEISSGGSADLGALVDPAGALALLAPPALLRSTFTRLMLLGGRGMPAFERLDERTGYAGERVVTWRIRWTE
jgi:dolichyl-diphosphooligosaccharide--protein glycosyltransferase